MKSAGGKVIAPETRNGPYSQMKQNVVRYLPKKRSNSFMDVKHEHNLYEDVQNQIVKPKIVMPKNFKQKYDKFSIKKVREEVHKNDDYLKATNRGRQVMHIGSKQTANTDYNSDYLLEDYSVFKITFDKDSTTVTDMGDSGFSFTETRGT